MNDGLVGGSRAAIYNKRQQQITTISHSFKSFIIHHKNLSSLTWQYKSNENYYQKQIRKEKKTDRQDLETVQQLQISLSYSVNATLCYFTKQLQNLLYTVQVQY